MRPHRLSVQAFGPFPGRVEVDLDALSSAGIFLIHGPTGAGKTSLLDAICFALYAAVPGARPSGRSLRSDHAAGDAVPEVALEFTAGGRRLQVVRSPEFPRPKRRGAGQTTVPASVRLTEWLDGGWAPLSSRADEVGDMVKGLLGMGMAQFVKVVLLPQGEFAAFLRATPESRRELLERLFDVSRFTDVEDWLGDQRRRGAAELAEAWAGLRADLTRVDDVLARLPPDLLGDVPTWETVALSELAALTGRVVDQVRAHAATALAERDTAEAQERDRLAAHHEAARQLVCREKGLAAQASLVGLDARQAELDALSTAVRSGRRASAVAGDLRTLSDSVAGLQAARARCAAAAAGIEGLGISVAASNLVRAQACCDEVAGFDDCLAEAAALAASLAAARERADGQDAVFAAAQQRGCSLDVEIERLRRGTATAGEAAHAAADIAAALPQAQRDVDDLVSLLRRRQELDTHQAELSARRERARAAEAAALLARRRWLDLRQEHIDGVAARLAIGLADGQPCPVCGSQQHPSPADPAGAVPDELVTAAESDCADREAELVTAQAQVASMQGRVLAVESQLAGVDRDAQELSADLAAAAERRDTAEAAVEELDRHRELANALGGELDRALADRQQAEGLADEAIGGLAAMQGELDRTGGELAERLHRHTEGCPCLAASVSEQQPDTPGGVPAVRARHVGVAAAMTGVVEALQALSVAEEHWSRTTAAVVARLRDNGFGSVVEVRAAQLSEDTLAGHERTLRQAERERVQAHTVVADPEVAAALQSDGADLPELAQQAAQARRARQQADRSHTIAEQCDRDVSHLRVVVCAQAARVTEESARQGVIGRLADTAVGLGPDNLLRMRLSSYVLAARLERVVELANERLSQLGDGRYQLRHSDRPVAGGRRSGLGLAIEDLWTGQARDTATLSGGESFMASLALALGLADGVREEAGGFELQTLFVDEGFGSLDEDSLEQVLAVLDDLRDGGRAIGVVSHVADLRARIPHQLLVTKTAAGSRVSLLGAGGAA